MTTLNAHALPRPWLACPTSALGVEAYWQAKQRARAEGLGWTWWLRPPGTEPPWDELSLNGRWRGLVLFEGGRDTAHLLEKARQHQVTVWMWPGMNQASTAELY